MSNKDNDEKPIIDVTKFKFDKNGKYELEEIVDPKFLSQTGGGGGVDLDFDLNFSGHCGDENAKCGKDIDIFCDTNFSCPTTNNNCQCGEDGDGE